MNDITRPIIGVENRSAQEVFDIMVDRIRSLPAAIAVETKPVAWVTEPSGLLVATIQHDDYSLIEVSKPRRGGFELTIHRGDEESSRWDDLSVALTAAEAAKLASVLAQPLLDAPRVKWQGSAGDLLASLDPDNLNPEQFNAWSALRRIIDAWDNNSGHEPSVSVLELAIDEARDTLSTDLVGVSPITKLAYRFQSIMSETLTVDPADNEIMGTGKASFLMARAALSAIKSGETP